MSSTRFPWPAAAPATWKGGRVRVLTLWRPWDQAILHGGKDVENRPSCWHLPAAGILVALHAGTAWDEVGAELVRNRWPAVVDRDGWHRWGKAARPAFPDRAIVGLAWMGPPLQRYRLEGRTSWAMGPWCYPLHEVLALEEPVSWTGGQGLRRLPLELEERLLALWAPRPMPMDPDQPAPADSLPLFQPPGGDRGTS